MKRNPEDILDEMLILRVQSGDQVALTELVQRWQPRLMRRAQQIIGRADTASDVVQEAWLAIIRGLIRLQDPGKFRSWAYRIVHNKSVDCVRAQARRRTANEAMGLQDVVAANHSDERRDGAEWNDSSQQLKLAIRQLETDQQLLLRMYYTDEMSLKEIAFATDIPAGTLKYRLFRMRQQLKETIERDNDEQH